MGFKFSYVCDLLFSLEANRTIKAASASRNRNPDVPTVVRWFDRHEKQIHGGETDRLALLSCLFPERRPDRVFGIREPSLVKVIGRCLLLGISRRQDLERWRNNGGGDLGECVENVMRQAENHIDEESAVTVEEVDAALGHIASKCRFSAPEVRRCRSAVGVNDALAPILRRLTSRDAKWLTRMIMKDYSPVEMPTQLVLRNFHFLLPDLLLFQDSFEAALEILNQEAIRLFPSRPVPQYAKALSKLMADRFSPRLGIKIGRPSFLKARSIKHCCNMAGKRIMSLEKKYDGEYCQIHINLSDSRDCIQIFSKSGKDSTADKQGVHAVLKQSLGLGNGECKFSRRCILEGELLVWSDEKQTILPFHKLRKHITRSGSFIGTENDSPPNPNEHLYMMFFDILLLDDDNCFTKTYKARRTLLNETVKVINGRAGIADQEYIDFSLPNSKEDLRSSFAMAAAQRWEGLVLKASDETYFTLAQQTGGPYDGHWIKMKKDYIPGLGDTADFAIIGARYDHRETLGSRKIRNLKWNTFFVGCLENAGPVVPSDPDRQVYRIVDVINPNNLNPQQIRALNEIGQFRCQEFIPETSPFRVRHDQPHLPQIEAIFKTPFVVEMIGFGFEKSAGAGYYTLRFPRVLKIHIDRGVEEATTFKQLQQLADEARSVPEDGLSQEVSRWTEKLIRADGRPEYIVEPSEQESSNQCTESSHGEAGAQLSQQHMPANTSVTNPNSPRNTTPAARTQSPTLEKRQRPGASQSSMASGSQKRRRALEERSSNIITISDDSQASSVQKDCHSQLAEVFNLTASKVSSPHSSMSVRDEAGTPPTSPPARHLPAEKKSPEHMAVSSPTSPVKRRRRDAHRASTRSITMPELIPSCAQSSCSQKMDNPFFHSVLPPIFLASAVEDKIRTLNPYLSPCIAPTITQFLHQVVSQSHNKHCQGVVVVDTATHHVNNAAQDIAQVGNALTKFQRAGKLPGAGRIFFCHWEALQLVIFSDGQDVLGKGQLERVAKDCFVACLTWGFGLPHRRRRQAREYPRSGRIEKMREISASRAVGDVTVSWDWRDMLTLLEGL